MTPKNRASMNQHIHLRSFGKSLVSLGVGLTLLAVSTSQAEAAVTLDTSSVTGAFEADELAAIRAVILSSIQDATTEDVQLIKVVAEGAPDKDATPEKQPASTNSGTVAEGASSAEKGEGIGLQNTNTVKPVEDSVVTTELTRLGSRIQLRAVRRFSGNKEAVTATGLVNKSEEIFDLVHYVVGELFADPRKKPKESAPAVVSTEKTSEPEEESIVIERSDSAKAAEQEKAANAAQTARIMGVRVGFMQPLDLSGNYTLSSQMTLAFDTRLQFEQAFIHLGVGFGLPASSSDSNPYYSSVGYFGGELGLGYYFGEGSTKPYVLGGIAPRIVGGSVETRGNLALYFGGGFVFFHNQKTKLYV